MYSVFITTNNSDFSQPPSDFSDEDYDFSWATPGFDAVQIIIGISIIILFVNGKKRRKHNLK